MKASTRGVSAMKATPKKKSTIKEIAAIMKSHDGVVKSLLALPISQKTSKDLNVGVTLLKGRRRPSRLIIINVPILRRVVKSPQN